jgi:hypothetical protein
MYQILIIVGSFFLFPLISSAQLEVNLLTDCPTDNIQIPVQIKNFDNVSSFELILKYNADVLTFQKSLIHNPIFTINNDSRYTIQVVNEDNSLKIRWSAYYGISISEEPLLFLEFQQVGNGSSDFTWIDTLSHVYRIGNVEQVVDYSADSNFLIPNSSPFKININQLSTGCRDDSENGCKAQAEVIITGASEPFKYQWQDKFNQQTKTAIGLCQDPVSVVVSDSKGCVFGDIFQAEIYPANNMQIFSNPEIAFITKPVVEFQSEYSGDEPQIYKWDFGDGGTSATANTEHTFEQVGNYIISLRTRSDEGCDTTVYINNFEVRELDFCIPNVFTPNGDNINDRWFFKIGEPPSIDEDENLKTGYFETKNCSGEDLIFNEHFKHTRLIVINRSGGKVYDCNDCEENWDGGSLPDGVYFYVFEWEGEYSSGREQGDVTILRGK